jgi:hypothetical protein
MSVKENVIRESMSICEKRAKEIRSIVFSKPVSKICQLRIYAQKIMAENKGDYKKIGELIEPLAKEEKKLMKLAEMQSRSSELISELSEVECELRDLKNELYFIENKK